MKILITTDTVGGVWHYTMDLVYGLMEERVEVVLVAMGPELSKGQLAQLKKIQKNGLIFSHRPYKLEWMDEPWEEVSQAGQWIKKIFDQEKPDLMHFNNYAQVSMGWEVPTVLVAHSCVASWWHSVRKEPLPNLYSLYFKTVQRAFIAADAVVFPSNALFEECRDLYGMINHPQVVYNGLAITRTESVLEYRAKKPILFSMGRLWDEAKNVDLLLRAAPYIAGEIFIAGASSKELSSPENVSFLGELTRQQIFNWLKISGIYVLPVKYEPFGLSFLEAASCRCALIGGDISTLREIWGGSMTYVDPENPKDLATACNELLLNQILCKQKGQEAFQRAQRYPLNKKKEQYLEIYGNLVNHTTATINGNE